MCHQYSSFVPNRRVETQTNRMSYTGVERPDTLARRFRVELCHGITSGNLTSGIVWPRRKILSVYGTGYVAVIEAMVGLEGTG